VKPATLHVIPAAHRFHPVNLDLWGVASRPLVVCGSSGGGGSSLLLLSPATLTFVPRILRLAILIQVCVLALLRLKITVARVSGSGIMGLIRLGLSLRSYLIHRAVFRELA
jgi:hypothetical protein